MHDVYLALGSNLGHREYYLRQAVICLALLKEIKIVKIARCIETDPVGGVSEIEGENSNKRKYLNTAMQIQTQFSPRELLINAQKIERQLGRNRESEIIWQDRTIDIDILFYEDKIIREVDLIIPHPRLHLRDFVLLPLIDLSESMRHPKFKKTVRELLDNLDRE